MAMDDIDKIFMRQWVGPFLNLEELKRWEKQISISKEFCLYLLSGKEYRKKNRSLYCGKSEMEAVSTRFKNHKKYEFTFSNNKYNFSKSSTNSIR